ncbi:MAG: hypothetical protein IJV44_09775 [Prevotella sp.]|nr:hypothetical protein [Prevotella sp.]
MAVIPDVKFRRLDTRNGLSNSQVNSILRDSHGHIWLGTQFGLCRYDGYRFKTFYSYERDTTTLRSNRVDEIQEAYDGKLWLDHGMNYSVYDPVTEKVDRSPSHWLAKQGIKGGVESMHIDSKKNFWIKTYDNGFFYYDPHRKYIKKIPFGYGPKDFSKEFGVSAYAETKEGMLLVSMLGELMCVDGEKGRVLWKEDYVKKSLNAYNDYWVYVDKDGIIWVITHSVGTYIYVPTEKRWYTNLTDLMRAKGFTNVPENIVVWEVRYDQKGLLWVATDHMGILLLDFQNKEWRQFTNVKGDETSLSDITAKHLYQDQMGRMWVATYKNGAAMSADAMTNFNSLALGDINGICEDRDGYYWLGLNSGGILKVDPATLEVLETYRKQDIGAASDVIVSNYTASDGSLWFGTWEGGLLKYKNGQWTNYTVTTLGSAFKTNNIWGVTEDYWGNMWIGVLGGGVVRMDKRTGRQRSFTEDNSKIKTVWTNSVSRASNGWILAGNSEYCSIINPKTMKVLNLAKPHDDNTYTISSATTQAVMDSHGLLWQASPSGVSVFDRKTGQMQLLDMKSGFYGSNVVALAEDDRHTMWVVTDHGISDVIAQKDEEDGRWTFAVRSYNDRDGLQPGPFNQRAICFTRTGFLLVGGQDGLDIINTRRLDESGNNEKPVFSGLVLFNEEVETGVEYNGRVILKEALDIERAITLKASENQFTIQMGSDNGGAKNHTRFIYRLKGFNDKWIKTTASNADITYMGLPAGSYTLCVRMLRDDGTMGETESQLRITIQKAWYKTWWAMLLWMLLIAVALWYGWKYYEKRQQQDKPSSTATEKEEVKDDSLIPDEEIEEAILMDDDE